MNKDLILRSTNAVVEDDKDSDIIKDSFIIQVDYKSSASWWNEKPRLSVF